MPLSWTGRIDNIAILIILLYSHRSRGARSPAVLMNAVIVVHNMRVHNMLICTHVPSLKNNVVLVKIKFVGDTLPTLIFYNAILIFITLRFKAANKLWRLG